MHNRRLTNAMSNSRILVALLAVAIATGSAMAAPTKAEAKQHAKLARVWIDFARWCKLGGFRDDAKLALQRAKQADHAAKDLERLSTEVDALTETKEPTPALQKRRDKAHADAAKVHDKLAKAGKEPRHELHTLIAAGLDPSKARWKRMAAKAKKGVTLIRHPDHPMVGYVSLPKGWTPKKKWPVLVAVDGAGSGFRGRANNFTKTRGSRGFIVLTPCSLSNTNALNAKKYPYYGQELLDKHNADRFPFDHDGLEKLLALIEERLAGSGKFAITGFSGGGFLCYGMTARHPDRVLFAAPACANFAGMGFADADKVKDTQPPIRIMTGAKDPHRTWTHGKVNGVPGIEPQTDHAVKALTELGFTDLTRTMLPGVGHSALAKQVWEWADKLVR